MKTHTSLLTIFLLLSITCSGQIIDSLTVRIFEKHVHYNPDLRFIPHELKQEDKGDEYRHLFFIHGLGGSAAAWSKVPEACYNSALAIPDFPARKCYVLRPDYSNSTSGSLSLAAMDVLNQIKAQNVAYLPGKVSPRRGILIGHSQGGMVCRSILHEGLSLPRPSYGYDYGGFISVATPLQGAMILNNRNQIIQWADNACNCLAKGPLESQNTITRTAINLLFKHLLGTDNYISTICEAVSGSILPLFFTKYYDDITSSYLTGASDINMFNKDLENTVYYEMPKITMYAVEPKDKIFWRTAAWLINSPNNVGYFEANEDLGFYKKNIEPVYTKYYTHWKASEDRLRYLEENKNAIIAIGALTFGATWIQYTQQVKKHQRLSAAWQQGKEWFEQSDSQWEVIIGARRYKPETAIQYFCYFCINEKHPFFTRPFYFPTPEICDAFNCKTIIPYEVTNYVPVLEENDGIVIRSSAENLPGMTHYPIRVFPKEFDNVTDKGSSHMQIRNDEGIKEHLKKAFDGDYGDFFRTYRK